MAKRCTSCLTVKALADFNVRARSKDGLVSTCKECLRARQKQCREGKLDQRRAYRQKYKVTARAKELAKAQRRRVLAKTGAALKVKARTKLNNAVRDGRIARRPCEICGSTSVHGHHDDYAKPLAVRWLCVSHHDEYHRMHPDG